MSKKLQEIYALLVALNIAHEKQRVDFLEIFPKEREFKFIPPKILGLGGKLIKCPLGIRVTTENESEWMLSFLHGVNKEISKIEIVPPA